MSVIKTLKLELEKVSDPKRAEKAVKFYQTFAGGYGEGDLFIGVSNPNLHNLVKAYVNEVNKEDLSLLIHDAVHEVRLLAVFFLVKKYQLSKKDIILRESWVNFYLDNLDGVNNWDIVDSSAYKILGDWLLDKDRKVLYSLAKSNSLWQERVAMVSTMAFIKNGDFKDAMLLGELLLHHKEDIMHKAVGWMLKEIGNKDRSVLEQFLIKHYKMMPRTTLRYSIEKFEENLRKKYLQGIV